MGVKEIRNIDDKVIWDKNSNRTFIEFAKIIYKENEEYTEKEDIPKPITTIDSALNYLKRYTELYIK